MQKRSLLRRQLIAAWKQTIDTRYSNQLINSERGLQCYFCAALLQEFDGLERRLFIEPRMTTHTLERRFPDIVIRNSKQVIGVVEIKYQPRGHAIYEKDLETLQWVASHPDGFTISNDRYLGPRDKKKYTLAGDAVLCWAGVYKGKQEDVKSQVSALLHPRFLDLHALTHPNEPAQTIPR